MRTFVKTENGKFVDAAGIFEITTSGSSGGTVSVGVNPMEEYVVARAAAQPEIDGYGTEQTPEQERAALQAQAGVLTENLIHAISRAQAIAKLDGNGAVVHFDAENRYFVITDLGKVAAGPQLQP